MKKAIPALFAFTLAVLLSGCIQPPQPTELPPDFSFEYGTGAMHLEWGSYLFRVDSSGNASFKKTRETALVKTYEFAVSGEERLKIYQAAASNGFFSLQDMYEDPSIMDGGWSEISITANSATKTVSMRNYSLPQFENIASEIVALLKSKLGEDCFNFDDILEDCGKKKAECEGRDTIECSDWKYFCGWQEITEEPTPEQCETIAGRQQCLEYCIENDCSTELCDALLFEATGCTACSPGCCSLCTDLDSCTEVGFCKVAWIHPSGESWQFGGCENINLCMGFEEVCDYVFVSYQGMRYTSLIEENQDKAADYALQADLLQDTYNAECE